MKPLLLSIVFLFLGVTRAQEPSDSTIFRAMQHELDRTLTEFSLPTAKYRPHYIRFMLFENTSVDIEAKLGALMSPVFEVRNSWVSPLVLFSDSFLTPLTPAKAIEAGRDVSYSNIRRALWKATDQQYRENYDLHDKDARKLSTLSTSWVNPSLLFWQPNPGIQYIRSDSLNFAIPYWTRHAIQLSDEFKRYPELLDSRVIISCNKLNYYSVSSEHSILKIPNYVVSISMEAKVKGHDNMIYTDRIERYAKSEYPFPTNDQLKNDIHHLSSSLLDLIHAPEMEDTYFGPVLLEKKAVGDFFFLDVIQTSISSKAFSLYFRVIEGLTRLDFSGVKICDPRLSITSYSGLSNYSGKPVFGKFEKDYDGFTPSPELKLVENGVLKAQFQHQFCPDRDISTTNAYLYYNPKTQAVARSFSPGLLRISVSQGISSVKLRKQLLSMAKKKGLRYAYIIRQDYPLALFRVDVNSGREERVTHASIQLREQFGQKTLIEYVDASKEEYLFDFVRPNHNQVYTVVVPDAILMDNCTISPIPVSSNRIPNLIPRP